MYRFLAVLFSGHLVAVIILFDDREAEYFKSWLDLNIFFSKYKYIVLNYVDNDSYIFLDVEDWLYI